MSSRVTPLPWGKIMVASCILFTNSFMFSVLMPFLSFMVSDFKVAPTEEEVGIYSGYLVGSFMLGQFLCSYFWGSLSDIYGRRPVILLALALTGFSFFMFGFSNTFTMAISLRLMTGCFNGIVGVTKTYMSEITDVTNQSQGFGIFGVSRGLGVVAGPIIGGYLSHPSKKYPYWFPPGSLFDIYPYALPCVIGTAIVFFGLVMGLFVLEESHRNPRSLRTDILEWFQKDRPKNMEEQPLINDNESEITLVPIWDVLQRSKVSLSLFCYGAVTFIYIQFDEVFALWSRLPIEKGGLGFESSQQGSAYAIGGFMLLLYQLFIFARVERALGVLNTFRTGVLFSIPAFLIMPFAGELGIQQDGTYGSYLWFIVGLCQMLRNIAGNQAFTATFMMISNSVSSKSRGSINGFGQTLAAFTRMLGPVFAGFVFSWSLENDIAFPFDFHFIFLLLSVMLSMVLLLSYYIDDEINHREEDEDDEETL